MNTFALVVNFAVTGAIVALCLTKRPFKLLDPAWAFIVGHFINYCIRPALFLINPEMGSAYGGMFNNDTIMHGFSKAVAFASVGLLGFAFGNLAFSQTSQRLAQRLPCLRLDDVLRTRSVRWLALVFLAAGWWGLRSFLSEVGWVGSFLLLLQGGERNQFSEATFGHGAFTFAAQLSLLGWALICAHWIATPAPVAWERRTLRRIIQFLWFALTLCIWAAFGERSSLMAVLFVPLALRYTFARQDPERDSRLVKVPIKKLVLTLGVLAFLVGGPLGLLFKQTEASTSAAISMSISAWDSFEFTVLAQNQLRMRDLRWGSTYFQDVVYSWAPRALFPSKPERYGIVRVQDDLAPELQANVGATFPPGMLVEAFANFGYIGLFLVPLLIGIFCRAVYMRFAENDAFWIVLLSFLFSTLASFRSFGGFLSLLLANGIVLCLVIALCRVIESWRWMVGRLHLERVSQA
jgi:hypothetical protein